MKTPGTLNLIHGVMGREDPDEPPHFKRLTAN